MARDEFVDLYEVLELPIEADTDELRKRINELYLDAQRNLDHRNVQKRLRYQQLYELYLPQARHLLLDPARRAEYHQYLDAYRARQAGDTTGAAVRIPPSEPEEPISHGELTAPAPQQTTARSARAVRREEEEDPVKLAAEREQLWSKWKDSLERAFAEEGGTPEDSDAIASGQAIPGEAPRLTDVPVPHAPVVRTHTATPVARTQPAAPAPVAQYPVAQPQVARSRPMTPSANPVAPRPAAPAYAEPESEAEYSPFALLHEQERLELIRSGIESAGIVRGFAVGIIIFLVGCVVIFGVDSWLSSAKHFPLGLTRGAFLIYLLCAVTALSVWSGWTASRVARRQASDELSYMSREELLRRNKR